MISDRDYALFHSQGSVTRSMGWEYSEYMKASLSDPSPYKEMAMAYHDGFYGQINRDMAYVLCADGRRFPFCPPKGNYFTLEDMQAIVDGYIEVVPIPQFDGDNLVMIVNEEGSLRNLAVNDGASALYRLTHEFGPLIRGNVIVCRTVTTEDGDEFK